MHLRSDKSCGDTPKESLGETGSLNHRAERHRGLEQKSFVSLRSHGLEKAQHLQQRRENGGN